MIAKREKQANRALHRVQNQGRKAYEAALAKEASVALQVDTNKSNNNKRDNSKQLNNNQVGNKQVDNRSRNNSYNNKRNKHNNNERGQKLVPVINVPQRNGNTSHTQSVSPSKPAVNQKEKTAQPRRDTKPLLTSSNSGLRDGNKAPHNYTEVQQKGGKRPQNSINPQPRASNPVERKNNDKKPHDNAKRDGKKSELHNSQASRASKQPQKKDDNNVMLADSALDQKSARNRFSDSSASKKHNDNQESRKNKNIKGQQQNSKASRVNNNTKPKGSIVSK